MFIVYSKQTGDIKNVVTGSSCKSLEELFPYDYKDYQIIYDSINLEDDLTVINNQDMFRIQDSKVVLKDDRLSKYR